MARAVLQTVTMSDTNRRLRRSFSKEPAGDDADRPLEQGRRPFPVRAHRLKRGEQDACHHRDGLGTARDESHGQTNGQDYDR